MCRKVAPHLSFGLWVKHSLLMPRSDTDHHANVTRANKMRGFVCGLGWNAAPILAELKSNGLGLTQCGYRPQVFLFEAGISLQCLLRSRHIVYFGF